MYPTFKNPIHGGQLWLPLLVFALCAGSAEAATDVEARAQISRHQSQLTQIVSELRGLESWRAVAQGETSALKTRYDGLHEVQRDLNTRFLALRDQQDTFASEWTAVRSSQQELASRYSQIVAQVQALTESQQQTEVKLAQAESQTGGRGMVQLLNQVDALNTELNKLRGKVEELGYGVTTAEKRQRDMYLDLDTRMRRVEQTVATSQKKEQETIAALEERLRKLEQSAQARPAAIPAPVNTAAASEAPAPAATGATQASVAAPESPQRSYEAAMASYRASDYQGAINGFQGFLTQYPQHALAANAQYWTGDAHFQLRDYQSAIEAQRKLISGYPDSPKVPDALLNLGSAELGLGDAAAARKTWEDLVARHPNSEAAEKAKQRLSRLR
jgi:tol-pal system protein YbgF